MYMEKHKYVLSYEHTERQRQGQAAAVPMLVNGDACHDAWNGGIDFGASQCIQWNQFDAAAATDAAARSVHTLRLSADGSFFPLGETSVRSSRWQKSLKLLWNH